MPDWLGEIVDGEGDARRVKAGLLAAAERLHGFGAWAWEPRSDRVSWSEGVRRILGGVSGPADLTGTLLRAHPDDRARLRGVLERARRRDPPQDVYYRILAEDGTVRFLHAILVGSVQHGETEVLYGLLRDLTAMRQMEHELAAHVAVSTVLRAWEGLATDGRRLLASLSEALGFTQAALWVPIGDCLEPRVWWSEDSGRSFERWLDHRRLASGEGLAGTAWERREPVASAQAELHAQPHFGDYGRREGLNGAAALPVIATGRVLAVIVMAGPSELELTDRLRGALAGIGHEIGVFLAQRSDELVSSPLSVRERELLQLAAEGLSGPQIAQRLTLSPSTVKTHFENIYAKYGVSDRVAAVAKAIRDGLIS